MYVMTEVCKLSEMTNPILHVSILMQFSPFGIMYISPQTSSSLVAEWYHETISIESNNLIYNPPVVTLCEINDQHATSLRIFKDVFDSF